VVIETYACGVLVVAWRIGAVVELVYEEQTGLLFTLRVEGDLATNVDRMWSHPLELDRMVIAVSLEYLHKFTPYENYRQMQEINQQVLDTPR
jgi:hypothetical protein